MGKITLTLPDELLRLVDHEVAVGDFRNNSAFVASLIEEYQERKLEKLVFLFEEAERENGATKSFDDMVEELRERSRSGA